MRKMQHVDLQRMGPLAEGHSALAGACTACKVPFQTGDYVTLIPIGPGDDEDERAKARDGRVYNAVAVVVHWACATGRDE